MAGANEGGAWDELLAHGRFVRSLARALVDDASLADDVAQGTWLAAAAHPPADRQRVAGWLRRVATNVALKLRRGESRRARLERAAAPREALPPTDAAVERLEAQRDVIDAVRGLDEKYRSIIVLRFFEDLSAREIARRLDMPVASVRTRLQRAVELLRTELTARNGGDERRWLAALAPLAWPHAAIGVGALAWAGGVIAVAAVLLIAGWIRVGLRGGNGTSPTTKATAAQQSMSSGEPPGVQSSPPSSGARAEVAANSSNDDVVVDGRVVDAIGAPVTAAEVAWQVASEGFDRADDWPTTHTTTTDGDGRFAFRGLDLEKGVVRARKPGFVATDERCWLAFNQRRARGLTLVLHEARSIHGSVVDENGRPVANAWVYGFTSSRVEFEFPTARTNGDGRFLLDGLPLSDVRVNAYAPGYRPDCSDPIHLDVEEVALKVRSEPRTRLELTVVDRSGRSVPGAWSSFTYSGPPPSESSCYKIPPGLGQRAIPDDGRLVRDDLPAGTYVFRVSGVYGPFDPRNPRLELRAGETTRTRIEAPFGDAAPRIRGRLVRVDGTPIGNERIAVALRDVDAPKLATTDSQGGFEVESPSDDGSSVLFWLVDPALALVKPDGKGGIAIAAVDSHQPVELVAEPTARLTGRVLDEKGAPIAGASIEVRGESRTSDHCVATTSSDFDGAFVFDALAAQPAPVELTVASGPIRATSAERFTIGAGDAIEHVTLTLTRAASIEGRVTDANGQPRAGALVGTAHEKTRASTWTDSNGRFRITGLSAGDHELHVVDVFDVLLLATSTPFPIHLDPGEQRTGFEIHLRSPAPTADAIAGRVLRSDGRLATDRSLSVVLVAPGGGTNCLGGRSEFEFHALKPDIYSLRARVFGDASLTSAKPCWFLLSREVIAEPGNTGVTLELPDLAETGTLHVCFSAGPERSPPPKVEWMVDPLSRIDPEGRSGFGQETLLKDGELSLSGFPPGDFKIEFGFETGLSIERSVTFRGGETIELGTIDLDRSARCRGFVVDPSGKVIEGVLVSPQRVAALRLGTNEENVSDARNSETCETGSDGGFDVALAHGALLFWKPGFAPLTWLKPAHKAPSDTPLRITLLPAGHLRFEDVPSDLSSRGACFQLRWLAAESGRAGYGTAEAQGSANPFRNDHEIFNLPVGDYEVSVWNSNGSVLTSTSGTPGKPPANDQPGVAHHWQVRIDAGATTRIDVARDW